MRHEELRAHAASDLDNIQWKHSSTNILSRDKAIVPTGPPSMTTSNISHPEGQPGQLVEDPSPEGTQQSRSDAGIVPSESGKVPTQQLLAATPSLHVAMSPPESVGEGPIALTDQPRQTRSSLKPLFYDYMIAPAPKLAVTPQHEPVMSKQWEQSVGKPHTAVVSVNLGQIDHTTVISEPATISATKTTPQREHIAVESQKRVVEKDLTTSESTPQHQTSGDTVVSKPAETMAIKRTMSSQYTNVVVEQQKRAAEKGLGDQRRHSVIGASSIPAREQTANAQPVPTTSDQEKKLAGKGSAVVESTRQNQSGITTATSEPAKASETKRVATTQRKEVEIEQQNGAEEESSATSEQSLQTQIFGSTLLWDRTPTPTTERLAIQKRVLAVQSHQDSLPSVGSSKAQQNHFEVRSPLPNPSRATARREEELIQRVTASTPMQQNSNIVEPTSSSLPQQDRVTLSSLNGALFTPPTSQPSVIPRNATGFIQQHERAAKINSAPLAQLQQIDPDVSTLALIPNTSLVGQCSEVSQTVLASRSPPENLSTGGPDGTNQPRQSHVISQQRRTANVGLAPPSHSPQTISAANTLTATPVTAPTSQYPAILQSAPASIAQNDRATERGFAVPIQLYQAHSTASMLNKVPPTALAIQRSAMPLTLSTPQLQQGRLPVSASPQTLQAKPNTTSSPSLSTTLLMKNEAVIRQHDLVPGLQRRILPPINSSQQLQIGSRIRSSPLNPAVPQRAFAPEPPQRSLMRTRLTGAEQIPPTDPIALFCRPVGAPSILPSYISPSRRRSDEDRTREGWASFATPPWELPRRSTESTSQAPAVVERVPKLNHTGHSNTESEIGEARGISSMGFTIPTQNHRREEVMRQPFGHERDDVFDPQSIDTHRGGEAVSVAGRRSREEFEEGQPGSLARPAKNRRLLQAPQRGAPHTRGWGQTR
ncbi:hypothetical protein K461DRAFT_272431 [Myriangium duriaei CBS 260.36]|uniref:Uncharacterized protein n=1 Tax=Myriangium duriaei CBS 260.36 TaxID=1168546 RepID=A0A9P4MBM9_9PEZI|nr:hypothetical protein K461DRAFT_272431 [Myriangium duriaei CBS 260.36]